MQIWQGHRARKRFGQNFLHDHGMINKIVRAIAPTQADNLIEIGPGMGAITELLLAQNENLNVIELDRDLIPGLKTKFFNYPNFTIHAADALKFDYSQLYQEGRKLRLVGNLPYNISTPLIFHLLSFHELIHDMHFMLQKEVVARLAAQPNTGAWGRLGARAQYYCDVEELFDVPPECFKPQPKVDSAIVRLTPKAKFEPEVKCQEQFAETLRLAFAQRRKTLRNNLKGQVSAEQLEGIGLDPTRRPETLNLTELVQLANLMTELKT